MKPVETIVFDAYPVEVVDAAVKTLTQRAAEPKAAQAGQLAFEL